MEATLEREEKTTLDGGGEGLSHFYCCKPGWAFCGYIGDPTVRRRNQPLCAMCDLEGKEFGDFLHANPHLARAYNREPRLLHHKTCPYYKEP